MSSKHNRGFRADNSIVDEKFDNTESSVEEVTETTEKVKEETEENVKEQSERIRGIVRCVRLNVRTEPVIEEGNLIGVLKIGDLITVDPNYSTDRWYKVSTDSGLDGYCVKDFIEFER